MSEAENIHTFIGRAKGKREPSNRKSVPFGNFITSIPPSPLFDYSPNFTYPMDGNDSVGDCVVAGWDHFRQVVTGLLTGTQKNFTQDEIWAFYQTQNPGFDPKGLSTANGPGSSSDRGMDIQVFLEYLVSQKQILGFARIDYTNEAEFKAAVYMGLGIITGVVIRQAQMGPQFFDGTWDYVPTSPVDGGHCVPFVGYLGQPSDQVTCVTWGRLINCTQQFITNQMDEAWFVLMQEHVDHPGFRNSFNLAAFAQAVSDITGGKVAIPVPIVPTPQPTPVPKPTPVPPQILPTVTLTRNTDNGVETLGTLTTGDNQFQCRTLERSWLNNQTNISCIPKGTYIVSWKFKLNEFRYRYQIMNVPKRTGIFMHVGDFFFNSAGCILMGSLPQDINSDKQLDLINSTSITTSFEAKMGKKDFILTIQ